MFLVNQSYNDTQELTLVTFLIILSLNQEIHVPGKDFCDMCK